MAAEAAKTQKNYFPLGGEPSADGKTATATCFCGAVQISFPTEPPGLVGAFTCHCTDDRKITASTHASNFTVLASHTTHTRGKSLLTQYAQSATIATGNTMTNNFCSRCGTLMYRASSGMPDKMFMRIGTVDDFNLHETLLKPGVEQFVEGRVGWVTALEGVEQVEGGFYK